MYNKNIYNDIWKFQLRGNNSVCAGGLQLLRGRSPEQFRGNIAYKLRGCSSNLNFMTGVMSDNIERSTLHS
jgi:hypothetical protein